MTKVEVYRSLSGMHGIVPLVLSFDLDDTLWPVGPVISAAETNLLAWLRERHPEALKGHDADSLRHMRTLVAAQFPERRHDLTFLRHRALVDLFAASGEPQRHADEAFEFFFTERNRVTLYDDVRPALKRLKRHYRLFALSNGNANLERCGVAALFEGHVTAIDAGAAKPDARIFNHLRAMTGVDAARILHVGDDPAADVIGALQAGMQAIWLNRDARRWPEQYAAPARTITTLADLF